MESVWLQQLSGAYSLWNDWSQDEKTFNISKALKVCAWPLILLQEKNWG